MKKYKLSEIAGRPTVFGLAHYSHEPLVGFDFAERKDAVDGLIDLIAPILEFGQFKDSLVAKNKSKLVGLNVVTAEDGIIGIQAIFSDGHEQEFSSWAGQQPSNGNGGNFTTLQVTGTVHGIVVYRDKLAAVGIQLVINPR